LKQITYFNIKTSSIQGALLFEMYMSLDKKSMSIVPSTKLPNFLLDLIESQSTSRDSRFSFYANFRHCINKLWVSKALKIGVFGIDPKLSWKIEGVHFK